MKRLILGAGLFLSLIGNNVMAATFTENFEDAFPNWESRWLVQNSNIQNLYGIGNGRGNNPDGLWLVDGLANGVYDSEISFNSTFGASLSSLSLDVNAVAGGTFSAYDMSNNLIYSTAMTGNNTYSSSEATYQTIFFQSLNGISRFVMNGAYIEGNTSVDNFIAVTGVSAVPVPAALFMFAPALLGFMGFRRRAKNLAA